MKTLCEKKSVSMEKTEWKDLETKVVATIRVSLSDDVMYYVRMKNHSNRNWKVDICLRH